VGRGGQIEDILSNFGLVVLERPGSDAQARIQSSDLLWRHKVRRGGASRESHDAVE
jgi:hypothetical protein